MSAPKQTKAKTDASAEKIAKTQVETKPKVATKEVKPKEKATKEVEVKAEPAAKVVKEAKEQKDAKAKEVKAPKEVKLPKAPKEPKEDADVRARVQLASVLNINISQARCATHVKQHLGDEAAEKTVKDLRVALKAANDAGNAAVAETLRAQLVTAAKNLVRISSETPIAIAVVNDCLAKELLRHGMDRAIAGERKIVDVGHLHEACAGLTFSPIYGTCPIWLTYDNLSKEAKAEAKAKAEAEAKTEAKADEAEVEESSKNSFYTYIENALKTVKKEEPYKTMRVSNRVREYVAELVAQGIARITSLARIIVQRIVGVRTMNADHVKVVVHMLMADAGRSAESIQAISNIIDEKLALYHTHLNGEREKKTRALDSTQLAALERKQREATLSRKKKLADALRTRAFEVATRVKALVAETAQLEPQVLADRAAAAH